MTRRVSRVAAAIAAAVASLIRGEAVLDATGLSWVMVIRSFGGGYLKFQPVGAAM